uniref:HNH endonuclease n=1 Tax=Pithovirus LCPAC304 TaxID=2506594 RepID=A0A481ZBX9_9VIRU|nr:MAG: HNH endonuclease [Pithovirus LCPAC304]
MEQWKNIEELSKYQISDEGQVRNKRTGKILKQSKNGYLTVSLRGPYMKNYARRTHVLVAQTFIVNPDPKNQTIVNHIDGDKFNNNVNNLEWVTPSENYKHALETGLIKRYTRSVCKLNKEGKIIKKYHSIVSASRANTILACSISDVCSGRKDNKRNRLTAGGFYWCYADKYSDFKVIKSGETKYKPVYQLNINTEEIIKWVSLKEASACTGVAYTGIIYACKQENRTSGGYKWRYAPIKKEKSVESEYETWKEVVNFPNYKISRDGRIYNVQRKRLRRTAKNKGYEMIQLQYNGKKINRGVHIFMAETYIPNPENKDCVNHINGDKSDNRVENLEWATISENSLHAKYILGKGIKSVEQLDNAANIVGSFNSIKEAHQKTGISYGGISNACRGVSKSSGGYTWRFIEKIKE